MVYVFDTCSISVLKNYYPDRFPSLWERFDSMVAAGRILSTREVYKELDRRIKGVSPWLWEWVEAHKGLFLVPGPEEQRFVAELFQVRHFQALVPQKGRTRPQPVADPFVVAAAKVHGGCVVTEETCPPNGARIPNVCKHFGIPFCNMQGFLEQNEWVF